MGASLLIFPIGNSKVVMVEFFLVLLSLLSPIVDSLDPCCDRSSVDCLGDCLVGEYLLIYSSGYFGACCFNTLPKSGY